MSDWKKIGKSSYNLSIGKFAEWIPSHSFTIPYQGPKIRYSEGDEITDVTDPGFDIDFTKRSLSDQHFPCGYWHKNYIPPQQVIYTSLLYPAEVFESAETVTIDIISGYFNSIFMYYGVPSESLETKGIDIISGVFSDCYLTYEYVEELQTTNINIVSGVFKDALWSYSIPNEDVETKDIDIVSGIFKDIYIEYSNGDPEDLETKTINIVSGIHES